MELSYTVEKILGIITNLAVEEFRLAKGLESDLESLQTSLSSINAVLQDAEEQRATNHRLSLWLRQLKKVLYDAEDVFDDFAYQVLHKQFVNTHGGSGIIIRKVRRVFSSNNSMVYRLRIGHRVKGIKQRLAEIDANKNAFNLAANLPADTGHADWLKDREMTGSFVNASNIIGRDSDRETIVQHLMDSHGQDISVVPIVGMGGLGKTALTSMIFNDQRVVECFESKVWVCLGDIKEFSVNQVMINIVKSLGVNNFNTQHMQDVIRGEVQNKRFLLVLDDMWNANRQGWLELKALLACGAVGSKIVVTTRINSVALCVGTVPAHDLKGLPEEECVLLFKKFAFASEGEVDRHLMKIGEQIVRKCKGVPLAVKNMGSVLYRERDEHKWSMARDNGIWLTVEADNNILPILKYSYDQLSFHLKQCFLFCLVFPEDHEFIGLDLISFWMAHGLLHVPKKKHRGKENLALQPEHVGKQYIKELVSRGFFQEFEETLEECRFKMHDLVRDLACLLVGEEFAFVNESDENICEKVRHVWVNETQGFSPESSNVLQTVLVSGLKANTAFAEACITKFKHLKVLGLSGSEFEELPNSIGTLKHLRSLDLQYCQTLKRLPNSVCKLHHLQTLLLGGCDELEKLPNRIGELINLRRLEVTTQQKQLPKNGIERLTSLQYLCFHQCVNLETIFDATQVHLLTSLETLFVSASVSLICLFDKLSSCSMSYCLPALEVLMLKACPNLNLNYMAGQQQQQQDGDDDSAVSPQCLQLPSLRVLSLTNMRGLEAWPECFQGYANTLQTLEVLAIPNLRALPEWLPNVTSLRTIYIQYCQQLECLPRGMERLTALNKLEIVRCGELSKRCKESKGEDWPMIAHVPHIRIK